MISDATEAAINRYGVSGSAAARLALVQAIEAEVEAARVEGAAEEKIAKLGKERHRLAAALTQAEAALPDQTGETRDV